MTEAHHQTHNQKCVFSFAIDKITLIIAVAVLGGGIACAGYQVSHGLLAFNSQDRIVSVKGLAERDVKANLALLPIAYSETGDDLAAMQQAMDEKGKDVIAFLKEFGLAENEITLQQVQVQDVLAQSYRNSDAQQNRYIVTQGYMVRTDKVDAVDKAVQELGRLVKDGIALSQGSGQPTYLFTDLNNVKPQMVAEATKNARETAQQFADDSGEKVGGIKKASQGVFQILARDDTYMVPESAQVYKRLRVVSTIDFYLE